jgi:DUF3011 family protein
MVPCESPHNHRKVCSADTRYGVALSRQLSSRACELGRDWGYDQNGIWVNNGCRAEFTLGATPIVPSMASSARPAVICESVNNRINHCSADTRFGVSLRRQLSDNACVRGDSWGWDTQGIWVKNGCRAEFSLDANP